MGGASLDKLLLGLGVTAVGLIVVFVCLIAIIVLCLLMTRAARGIQKVSDYKQARAARRAADKAVPKQPEEQPPAQVQTAQQTSTAQADDTELLAVLTAAVATVMGTPNIAVVAYRPKGRSAWSRAGRSEQIYQRI